MLITSALVLPACGRPSDSTEAAAPAPSAAAHGEKKGVERASSAALKPLAQKKFGTEITEKTPIPLTQLVRTPSKFASQTVRTEGVVSAVCKSMGCWMELADEAGQAHIKMAGHSFFVPKDSAGHRAIIQGKVINAPKDDECSEEARQQTGQVAKIEIEATGVEFVD
ncbi:Hypothetical protein A7982_07739 [Minicystis rosea]|nr:Hypothetical protein A7982_07739 [Minicystis rosea]